MDTISYDIIIIGAGPAGSKCAIKLAKAGKKVALIEKDAIGGVCLNRGCIPSKSYLYLIEILETIKKSKRFGIKVSEPEVLWDEVKKRKDLNVKMLGMGLEKSIKSAGAEIIIGTANLTGEHEVEIQSAEGAKKISAQNIVLAMGTEPLFLNIMPKGEHVISSTEILNLTQIPKSLTIIGGGVTGVEMASVFSALGVQVTIIEKLDSLLPALDKEITDLLKKSLEKKGCKIYLQTAVVSCQDGDNQAEVIYKTADGKEEKILSEKALVVIGRKNSCGISVFEKLNIKTDERNIILNNNLQTSLVHVYVIGDLAGRNLTAYGGEREGEHVAAHILGEETKPIDYGSIPVTVFSHPEIGQAGLTQEQAEKLGIEYQILKSDYAANAKAAIIGEREGLVKIIIEKNSQKILGVHIIGFGATDLIHQALVPVSLSMTVSEWLEIVWSHPVLAEVVKSALESVTSM